MIDKYLGSRQGYPSKTEQQSKDKIVKLDVQEFSKKHVHI